MTAWLDHVAAEILITDQALRTAVRNLRHGRPDPHHHPATPGRLTVSPHQVQALLRGIIPAAIALTPRRLQHARLAAALHQLGAHLLTLNGDTNLALQRAEAPIAAAIDLITEAREWVRQARWNQATSAAKVKGWRAPLSISPINQLVTKEQAANAPSAVAGLQSHPAASLHLLKRLTAHHQLSLDLPPPPSAEVIDFRQLQLFPAARAA